MRKQYERPKKRWSAQRIEAEKEVTGVYGLKNKREIRRAETLVRNKRANARNLLALEAEERGRKEKSLLESLIRLGVLRGTPSLDDVLTLSTNDLLERRLQTIVMRKGLALTSKQARQLITHGHIAVNGKRVSSPGYLVKKSEETMVTYYGKAIVLNQAPKRDLKKEFEEAAGMSVPADSEVEKTGESVPVVETPPAEEEEGAEGDEPADDSVEKEVSNEIQEEDEEIAKAENEEGTSA